MSDGKDGSVNATDDGAGGIARLVSYAVILLMSVVLFLDANGLPTSRWEVLGAGAFPQLVFGLLIVLSFAAIVDGVRKLPAGAAGRFPGATAQWLRKRYLVVIMFALFAVYLIALPFAGFSWATFAFLMVAQILLSPRTPKALLLSLVIALVFSFGLNTLFGQVFNVFLPRAGV